MSTEGVARVAIIGCGLIGSQWDSGGCADAGSRTHAAAFSRHPESRLAAMCDRNFELAQTESRKWGCEAAFDDPERLFSCVPVDAVVVATSSAVRLSVIQPALMHGVPLLVIEKPLAATLEESEQLATLLAGSGVRTLVNYSRRWDRKVQALREQILAGVFGRVQRMVGCYGKGLINNGSHMVDLVGYLLAAIPVRVRALGSPLRQSEADWSNGQDPALDVQLVFDDAGGQSYQLDLLGTDHTFFTCFELKIIFENAMVEFLQGGRAVQVTRLQPDPRFPKYTIPGDVRTEPTALSTAMDCMADEVVGMIRDPSLVARCSVSDALHTARAVDAVRSSLERDGSWVSVNQYQTS